jgi:flagellar biosynthesis/type III secretory pathway protein FliH
MYEPDYVCWADNITKLSIERLREEIKQALEQAYNQGYQLGLNKGWQHELEHDVEWQRRAIEQDNETVPSIDEIYNTFQRKKII